MTLRILYDGWWLAARPNSAEALHLLTLLAYCPAEIEAIVAVPAMPTEPLPPKVVVHLQAGETSASGRLRWEQRTLPQISHAMHADLVHLSGGAPALFARSNQLLSPAGNMAQVFPGDSRLRKPSFTARLGDALGQGGLARLRGMLWPEGLPLPASSVTVKRLPRVTHPAFGSAPDNPQSLDIPETYVLYHGPLGTEDVHRLLNAWSWAAGAIGDNYPLLIAGAGQSAGPVLPPLLRQTGCESSVRLLPALDVAGLAALYQGCSALFHPTVDSPWEGAISLAMVCRKPVVALETPWSDALVGPAGYLIPAGEDETTSRAQGAALITVIVEESVAERLSEQAGERAASWSSAGQAERFTKGLSEVYASLAAQQAGRHERQDQATQQE